MSNCSQRASTEVCKVDKTRQRKRWVGHACKISQIEKSYDAKMKRTSTSSQCVQPKSRTKRQVQVLAVIARRTAVFADVI
jgi:hypothetical protein